MTATSRASRESSMPTVKGLLWRSRPPIRSASLWMHSSRPADAIELAVILAAILQVIDDLQRRAEGIIGRPGNPAFTMYVEHEASNRHGRVCAVADQIVPIAVAQLGHIHAERGEQVLCVARGELTGAELRAQGDTDAVLIAPAEQCRLEPVKQRELILRRKVGMVRDIVRSADEFVECEDRRAMARMNQPRRHGEIFVPMALARACFDRSDHHGSDRLACTRPFQAPPRPRTYWYAESRVKSIYCKAIAGSAIPHKGDSRYNRNVGWNAIAINAQVPMPITRAAPLPKIAMSGGTR